MKRHRTMPESLLAGADLIFDRKLIEKSFTSHADYVAARDPETVKEAVAGFTGWTTEQIAAAAQGRVMDISEHYMSLLGSLPDGSEIYSSEDMTRWWVDLPLVTPPCIGILGWWIIAPDVSVLVREGAVDEPGSFALTVMATTDLDAGEAIVVLPLLPQITITDDGWYCETFGSVPDIPGAAQEMRTVIDMVVMCVLLASSLVNLHPKSLETTRDPEKLAKARAKRGQPPKPAATSRIMLPGLAYDHKAGTWHGTDKRGVPFHSVRGHWRELRSARFTRKQGQRVWVRPAVRGNPEYGTSTRGYEYAPPVALPSDT